MIKLYLFLLTGLCLPAGIRLHAQATIQTIWAPPLPESLDFAGESVPLSNFDVVERLDRELLIWCFNPAKTIVCIKRSFRYFPIIEPILRRYNIPDDFKYLAVAESDLLTEAYSKSHAVGVWQFKKETAELFGLEVNESVDERYHLEKATEAACRYFRQAYERLGNWTLVAAAYNMGITGIQERMKAEKEHLYYHLYFKTEEPSRYVFRVLSYKIIHESPDQYGIHVPVSGLYPAAPSYREVIAGSGIDDLAAFADQQKCSYRMLKLYNPWLRTERLPAAAGKTYRLRIPIE